MHAIKGSWVGQTFALAKLNESGGGRKTRIRRSKEERKTMVESFIKKYQMLNNGSFPSLSLTHKEVGGSFYTVREIVREIIQENRVLGPAKLTDNNNDIFAKQYPLGSISIDPQIDVESSNETHTIIHVVPNQYQGRSEEVALDSSGQYYELRHQTIGDEKLVTEEIYRKEESEMPMNIESEICLEGEKDEEKTEAEDVILEASNQSVENGKFVNGHTVEIERKEVEESTAKVTLMKTEIVVETFPLRPAFNTAIDVDKKLDEKETDKIELDECSVRGPAEISSCLVDEKVEANLADSLSESVLVDDKIDTSFECLHGSTIKESVQVDVSAGNQPMSAPAGACIENFNNTNTCDSDWPSISKETIEINNIKPDIQLHDEPTKICNPTLDRINLESWEATSKKSGRPDINPLFETIKAFIAAFVKFWSE